MAFKWEAAFNPAVLSRGKNYFLRGSVHDFVERENMITASVRGAKDYQVRIVFDKLGGISFAECDCPYPHWCKHMAAVLYVKESRYEFVTPEPDAEDSLAAPSSPLTCLDRDRIDKWPQIISLTIFPTSWKDSVITPLAAQDTERLRQIEKDLLIAKRISLLFKAGDVFVFQADMAERNTRDSYITIRCRRGQIDYSAAALNNNDWLTAAVILLDSAIRDGRSLNPKDSLSAKKAIAGFCGWYDSLSNHSILRKTYLDRFPELWNALLRSSLVCKPASFPAEETATVLNSLKDQKDIRAFYSGLAEALKPYSAKATVDTLCKAVVYNIKSKHRKFDILPPKDLFPNQDKIFEEAQAQGYNIMDYYPNVFFTEFSEVFYRSNDKAVVKKGVEYALKNKLAPLLSKLSLNLVYTDKESVEKIAALLLSNDDPRAYAWLLARAAISDPQYDENDSSKSVSSFLKIPYERLNEAYKALNTEISLPHFPSQGFLGLIPDSSVSSFPFNLSSEDAYRLLSEMDERLKPKAEKGIRNTLLDTAKHGFGKMNAEQTALFAETLYSVACFFPQAVSLFVLNPSIQGSKLSGSSAYKALYLKALEDEGRLESKDFHLFFASEEKKKGGD